MSKKKEAVLNQMISRLSKKDKQTFERIIRIITSK
jgi:hypothetical protein